MSVVLRCPTCGTTQAQVGECEACFEGEVRYFCTNHGEGIWLDASVCNRCGAKFGDVPRTPPASRTTSVPTRPRATRDFERPDRRPRPERTPEPDVVEPEVLPRTPSLGELLEEITREGARARGGYEAEVPWRGPRIPRPPVFPLAGCLVRIVGLVFLLIVATIIFLFVLFGGLVIR